MTRTIEKLPAGSVAEWRSAALRVLRRSGRADAGATVDDVDRLLSFTTTDDDITLAALHTGAPEPTRRR